jgi:hypothetical protein
MDITQKRVISNKFVDMTAFEFELYQKISSSYDRPNFKGESLFNDIFESDDNGIIIALIPPTKSLSSWECFLFIMSIFQHQHVRAMYKEVEFISNRMNEKLTLLDQKLALLDDKLKN